MKSKNKAVKLAISVLAILIAVWICLFITDYIRCGSLKEPLFVVASDDVKKDGGSGTYYGLGYTVKIEKDVTTVYGVRLLSVEMWMFDRVISASIQ